MWGGCCSVFPHFQPHSSKPKFDPKGAYIKRWVPVDSPYIHSPWQTPSHVLENAGVQLEISYPLPIVDHAFARKRALKALKTL